METFFEAGSHPSSDFSEQYRDWMSTSSNLFNCSECPERRKNWSGHEFPCCQQNCWVNVTCFPEDFVF